MERNNQNVFGDAGSVVSAGATAAAADVRRLEERRRCRLDVVVDGTVWTETW